MAEFMIDELFDHDRFPQGGELLPLLFYFPFGVLLAIVRLFIGLHALLVACVLPRHSTLQRYILRCMCAVLGIVVSEKGVISGSTRVFVTNYSSILDHLAFYLCHPVCVPCVWSLPSTVAWLLGYTDMSIDQGRERFVQNVKKHCTESLLPICVFPEVSSTNGKAGLLKFSTWPFSLEQQIQPAVIRMKRPLLARVAPSVLGSWWLLDVFWFLFVPYTCFTIKFLPVTSETDDESCNEFAVRVQQLIASDLKIEATSFTSADKAELVKRIIADQAQAASLPTNSGQIDEMTSMARLVQAVLPHVPIQNIKDDLALTRDVDLTVSNILEGRVKFTPTEPGIEADAPTTTKPVVTQPSIPQVQPKRANMTFQERKRELFDHARRRYKEKHGLT